MLRLSAVEFMSFAGLYAIFAAITLSWFILGAAVICVAMAANHRTLARTHPAKVNAA